MDKYKIILISALIVLSTIIIFALICIIAIKKDPSWKALKPVSEEEYDPLMQID